MITSVDTYFIDGCGRCKYFATPDCKVNKWHNELKHLRSILLECGLQEELKWQHPCYTNDGKNIIIIGAFKEFCSLNFFKGSLLQNKEGLLVQQTENVQAGRIMKFTNTKDITKNEKIIKAYIYEAIEIERAGVKIEMKKTIDFELPEELKNIFKKDTEYKKAFNSLTPGRQRGYILHFSAAKQTQTRIARIEKYKNNIFAGKGWNE